MDIEELVKERKLRRIPVAQDLIKKRNWRS